MVGYIVVSELLMGFIFTYGGDLCANVLYGTKTYRLEATRTLYGRL